MAAGAGCLQPRQNCLHVGRIYLSTASTHKDFHWRLSEDAILGIFSSKAREGSLPFDRKGIPTALVEWFWSKIETAHFKIPFEFKFEFVETFDFQKVSYKVGFEFQRVFSNFTRKCPSLNFDYCQFLDVNRLIVMKIWVLWDGGRGSMHNSNLFILAFKDTISPLIRIAAINSLCMCRDLPHFGKTFALFLSDRKFAL